jgi:hypothetical protein
MGRATGGGVSIGDAVNGSIGDIVVGVVVGSTLVGRIVVGSAVGSLLVGNGVGSDIGSIVGSRVKRTLGLLVLEVGLGLGRT